MAATVIQLDFEKKYGRSHATGSHVVEGRLDRFGRLLSIAVSLPSLPLADLAYRGCDGIFGSLELDLFSWCLGESWLSAVAFQTRCFASCLAVLFLVLPEFALRRYNVIFHFEPRQVWNRLRFRLHFSWMALYFIYVSLSPSATHDTSPTLTDADGTDVDPSLDPFPLPADVMLVSCFPNVIRSPAGYIGLCAVVSCVSSGLWLVMCSFVYMVGVSKLPRDPTDDGIDEFVWMMIIGMTNYYRDADTVSQVAQFLVVRVMTHFVTSHVFKAVKPVIRRPLSHPWSTELHEFDLMPDNHAEDLAVSSFTQTRAFIVLILITALPGYVAWEIYDLTDDFQLAVWSTFPAWTIYGKAARCMTKFYVFSARRWQNVKLFNLTFDYREVAKVGGKLVDLLVVSFIFINIAMPFVESETGSAVDTVLLVGWMLFIVGHRFSACARAIHSVHSQRAALKLASEGDPQINDVCQICSGDIDTNTYWHHSDEEDDTMAGTSRSASMTSFNESFDGSWAPRVTPCGHVFHRQCIRSWVMHRVPNCPVCGRLLKTTNYHELRRFR